MPVDPQTVALIAEKALPLIGELIKQIKENQSKLQEILKKIDQIFLRDINSAFDAIKDASFTDNIEIKKRLLDYAESKLRSCSGEGLHGTIGDHSSAYYVALSHFGLFTIFKLRGENELAVRHVLKAFTADPRTSREGHFLEVYRSVFLPNCNSETNWYNQRLIEIENDNFENRILANQAFTVAKGIGATVIGALSLFSVRNAGMARLAFKGVEATVKEFEEITPQKYQTEMKGKAKVEYESMLDKKCRDLANKMLE